MMSQNYFLGLAHIAVFTDRFEDTVRFYTEIFPFVLVKELVEEREDDTSGFFPLKYGLLKLNDLYLEIMESADKRNFNGIEGAVHHIGIKVADIEKALDFLLKRGFSASALPEINVNTSLYPGKTFRAASTKGINGEIINLYEMDNADYFDEKV
jgi:catechol 2,3-dioxygenase-like lactoylglutathione lyase family enzyme